MDKYEIAIIRDSVERTIYEGHLDRSYHSIDCEFTSDEVDKALMEKGLIKDEKNFTISDLHQALKTLSEMGFELKAIYRDDLDLPLEMVTESYRSIRIVIRYYLQRKKQ